jgi:integral membrane protein
MTEHQQQITDVPGARSRLTFFKVMAFIVCVGLLVLVVEMVLSYVVGLKGTDNPLHWWPQPHGFIYMVYLVATALLGFKVGWSLPKMVGVMLAGCVPFLSFWVERTMAKQVDAQLRAAETVLAPGAGTGSGSGSASGTGSVSA